MAVNLDLKSGIIKRFGSQVVAAREMGIREARLSYIVRGHAEPKDQEREALEQAMGRYRVRKWLKGPRETTQGGVIAE